MTWTCSLEPAAIQSLSTLKTGDQSADLAAAFHGIFSAFVQFFSAYVLYNFKSVALNFFPVVRIYVTLVA